VSEEFDALMPGAVEDVMGGKYRLMFSSPMGREVLADILSMCHFGATLDLSNPLQVAEYNLAVVILAKCGVFSPGTGMDVVNALLNVLPK
jgi:hypothetical protein